MANTTTQKAARHVFHSLWAQFGPYGRQDVHYHPCTKHEGCSMVLIGSGRNCDGKNATHHEEKL
jgi:hypothetical protein